MADTRYDLYLVAYDIADSKRLARVHRVLKQQGLPVQYSVFTVVLKRKALLHLLERISALINQREDDVRCYRLLKNSSADALGQQYFPDDVMLFTDGVNRILVQTEDYK